MDNDDSEDDMLEEENMIVMGTMTQEEINHIIIGPPDTGRKIMEVELTQNETRDRDSSKDRRAYKRAASTEGEEGEWVTVESKKKTNCNSSDSLGHEELCEVTISGKENLPKQIGLAKILRETGIQGIIKVTYKSPYKVVLRFSNYEKSISLMECQGIRDRGWICRRSGDILYSYGLIRYIEMELSNEEIMNTLESSVEIIAVKRLKRKDESGNFIDSETVRICFKGPTSPPYVKAYGCRMKVEPFTFPVTQCSKCWRYGHIRNNCSRKTQICPKCGGEHENCETTNVKCINCKGGHMALVKSLCPVFKREKNIREVMARNQCTYKMALKKVGGYVRYGTKTNYQREVNLLTPEVSEITESVTEKVHDTSCTPREVSYAEVVKTPSKTERRTVNTVHRLKKPDDKGKSSINNNQFQWIPSFDCGTQEENKNKKKERFELRVVISRLKEIMCSDMEFEMKMTAVLKYLVEEVIRWLKENFTMEFVWKLLGGLSLNG